MLPVRPSFMSFQFDPSGFKNPKTPKTTFFGDRRTCLAWTCAPHSLYIPHMEEMWRNVAKLEAEYGNTSNGCKGPFCICIVIPSDKMKEIKLKGFIMPSKKGLDEDFVECPYMKKCQPRTKWNYCCLSGSWYRNCYVTGLWEVCLNSLKLTVCYRHLVVRKSWLCVACR